MSLDELLSDPVTFSSRYPKAAEYLSIAPGLPGTADAEADHAFDMRLLRALTDARQGGLDAYWRIVAPSVTRRAGRRVVDGGDVNGSARLGYAQMILQDVYAYAIPSPETIQWMAKVANGLPIVELGAGRGYWAAQLAGAGLQVTAYDLAPPGSGENASFSTQGQVAPAWCQVGDLQAYGTRLADGANFLLLLCWPPGWGDPMASTALMEFAKAGGRQLIYIGEPKGGRTGDDPFFDALDSRWDLHAVDPEFVSWWNLNDSAQSWFLKP